VERARGREGEGERERERERVRERERETERERERAREREREREREIEIFSCSAFLEGCSNGSLCAMQSCGCALLALASLLSSRCGHPEAQ
jgi:hypothetical protein